MIGVKAMISNERSEQLHVITRGADNSPDLVRTCGNDLVLYDEGDSKNSWVKIRLMFLQNNYRLEFPA